jgi:hypothetical protein
MGSLLNFVGGDVENDSGRSGASEPPPVEPRLTDQARITLPLGHQLLRGHGVVAFKGCESMGLAGALRPNNQP